MCVVTWLGKMVKDMDLPTGALVLTLQGLRISRRACWTQIIDSSRSGVVPKNMHF